MAVYYCICALYMFITKTNNWNDRCLRTFGATRPACLLFENETELFERLCIK